jgi:hypothetical protein
VAEKEKKSIVHIIIIGNFDEANTEYLIIMKTKSQSLAIFLLKSKSRGVLCFVLFFTNIEMKEFHEILRDISMDKVFLLYIMRTDTMIAIVFLFLLFFFTLVINLFFLSLSSCILLIKNYNDFIFVG